MKSIHLRICNKWVPKESTVEASISSSFLTRGHETDDITCMSVMKDGMGLELDSTAICVMCYATYLLCLDSTAILRTLDQELKCRPKTCTSILLFNIV
ncbi:hypothetical protein CEXT_518261 [Caerostris extrusa]|uniref:Uncharacterized protein n=1 Tax=Caerostris extrusa TaxID=172846 RepID=A0AAV4TB67_CAEEX|nr:hypothetical protein CEXT_518261 [Caerostris extrusa]